MRGIVGALRKWFIEPAASVVDPAARQSARWLATVFAVMLPIGFVVVAASELSMENDIETVVFALTLPMWILPYVLARRGQIKASMAVASLSATVIVMAIGVLDKDVDDFHFLLMPLLFSAVLLPTWFIGLQYVISMCGVLLLHVYDPSYRIIELLYNAGGFLTVGGTLAMFTNHHRESLARSQQDKLAKANAQLQREVDRRRDAERQLTGMNAELEQTVATRTAELRFEQERLSALLDSMGEGVAYIQEDSIQYFNRALLRMLGLQESVTFPRPIDFFLNHIFSRAEQHQVAARWEGHKAEQWAGAVTLKPLGGEPFDAMLAMYEVHDVTDRPAGYVLLVRDISYELALQRQREMFMTNASHELRTPVTNIITRLWLARRQPDRIEDHLEVIQQSALTLQGLIEEILNITRLEGSKQTLEDVPTDLGELLRSAVQVQQEFAASQRVQLAADVPSGLMASVDVTQMMQVLRTVIANATLSTDPNGMVSVSLESEGQDVVVRVKGGPPGLTAEEQQYVFEPFSRVSQGDLPGSMFGLVVAQRVISMHHGALTVSSQPGEGSIFQIRLPRVVRIKDRP